MSTTIQNLLLNPFRKNSKNIAIDTGNRKISYEQLECKVNMIANLILQNGCEKQEIIAIYMEDKENIISTILAVLKMGCVFAAIDPSYPNNRIQQQLSVITPPLVLTDSDLLNNKILNDFQYLAKNINEAKSTVSILPEIEYLEDDKVYIYFTSGTTGIPNAITGKNKSLAHFIEWESNELAVQPTVRVSQLTPPGHDPFLRDVFLALTNGGCICIPPDKNTILEPSLLCEWIDQLNIEIIHCTPSLFSVMNRKMLSNNDFKNLKYVLLAGEKIIPSQLTYWYETFSNRIQLYNLYGPTETTMAKLFYPIQPQDAWRSSIPIGKSIKATRVLIMNNKKICDVGEIGEIYIRTPYMTYGYINNEHLQNERFIQNPFKEEKDVIFKTGDLGRLLSDGNIDFVGRVDRQIKIRGQRVELSEIENKFLQIKGTINCAAVYHEKESHDREQCCIYCGLTSNYPGVSFNEKGICNFCETFPALKKMSDTYFKKIGDLEELLKKNNNVGSEYDCMLLFSGGKDSTYALYKLHEMGLKVLAYVFDNGYISEKAKENIRSITSSLNVDCIFDNYEDMPNIFLKGLNQEGSVCNGCFKVLRKKSTRLAYEKKIKFIITGFSIGQIYELRLYSILKYQKDEKSIDEKIFEQRVLYHSEKDYISEGMPIKYQIDKKTLQEVELIDFYRYCNVSQKEILNFLSDKSDYWNTPDDTGMCSSNCLINDLGIFVQRKMKGYDNYSFPTSWEVRTKHITLEEANKSKEHIDQIKVKSIAEKLNYEGVFDRVYNQSSLRMFYTAQTTLDEQALRNYMRERLPDYMLPSQYHQLSELPLTANNKVDYAKLLSYVPTDINICEDEKPEDIIEEKLVEIWKEILGIDKIGMTATFTDLGGHSLSIMSLIAKINHEFDVEFPLGEAFRRNTVRSQAEYLKEHLDEDQSYEKDEYVEIENLQAHKENHHPNHLLIDGIQPFNDLFYMSCFYNAFFPALIYFKEDIMRYLVNYIPFYTETKMSARDFPIMIDYIESEGQRSLIKGSDILYESKNRSDDILYDVKESLNGGKLVILCIDAYYLPNRKDTFMQNHWKHYLLVYGYDDASNCYYVLEHSRINSLDYKQNLISYQDIHRAYEGYMNNFSKYNTFVTISKREKKENDKSEDLKFVFSENYFKANEMVLTGIEKVKELYGFYESFQNIEEYIKNIGAITFSLTEIFNVKRSEKYLYSTLIGTKEIEELGDKIIYCWDYLKRQTEKIAIKKDGRVEQLTGMKQKAQQIYDYECKLNRALKYKIEGI